MVIDITLPREEIAREFAGEQRIAMDIESSRVFLTNLSKLTNKIVNSGDKKLATLLKGFMNSYKEYYEKTEELIKILYKDDKAKLKGWTQIVKTNQAIFRDLENQLKKVD